MRTLRPKLLKSKTEIPKQVRDDKNEISTFSVMLNLFQHLVMMNMFYMGFSGEIPNHFSMTNRISVD